MTGGMPYLVKPDEEVFVPEVNGHVLTNQQVANRANTANGGSNKPIIIPLTIPIEGLGLTLKKTIRVEAEDLYQTHVEYESLGGDKTRRFA